MLNSLGLSYADPIAISDFLIDCDYPRGSKKPRHVHVSRDHTCLPCEQGQRGQEEGQGEGQAEGQAEWREGRANAERQGTGEERVCPCRLGEYNVTQDECVTGGGVSFYGGAGGWVLVGWGMRVRGPEGPAA